jgi:hypothetical protein
MELNQTKPDESEINKAKLDEIKEVQADIHGGDTGTGVSIHIPRSEIATIVRLEMKQKDFITKVRNYEGDPEFDVSKSTFTTTVSILGNSVLVCRGKANFLGIFGCVEIPCSDEQKTTVCIEHHWTWPWATPELATKFGDSSKSIEVLKSDREAMKELLRLSEESPVKTIFVRDGMIISYLQAVMHDDLGFEFIHNVPLGEDAFASYGITDLEWTKAESMATIFESMAADVVDDAADAVDVELA